MESELTPQAEKLIEKINALPDGKNLYTGTVMYEGHGRTRLDTEPARITTDELKALAARDKDAKCPDCGYHLELVDDLPTCYRCDAHEWEAMYRKDYPSQVSKLDRLQTQLTTALERVRAAEPIVDRILNLSLYKGTQCYELAERYRQNFPQEGK